MDIRVDPVACKGHGLCAEMLPEWIRLDEWGYPILDGPRLPDLLAPTARRAARSCPELAILLTTDRR